MSKRILNHPQETKTGPQYWRSLGQVADTPEFKSWVQREFPEGASEVNLETSRRSFMTVSYTHLTLPTKRIV